MKQQSVDILIPAYNEENNISLMYLQLDQELQYLKFEFNFIFINDGSEDQTLFEIKRIAAQDPRVKYIDLSRNFGHQNALKAGLDHGVSSVAIMMDCDLQHPVKLIANMLALYEDGFDIVRTLRDDQHQRNFFKKFTSIGFYKVLNLFSDIKLEAGSADFRLVSGKALDQLKSFVEFDLFYRGLTKWIGFKQATVKYTPELRLFGHSKYSIGQMLSFGLKGFTSFSTKPLYFAAYMGLFFSICSLFYIPYILYTFYLNQEIPGWSSVIASVAFFGGLNLSILGIIGIYLSKLFTQSKCRPHYIVRESKL